MSSGACVLGLHQKSVTKEAWPVLQWAPGDVGAWHGVTNTLHFYGVADGFKGARDPAGTACCLCQGWEACRLCSRAGALALGCAWPPHQAHRPWAHVLPQ